MTGAVTSELRASIAVGVRAPDGQEQTVSVLVDTGFDGFLALRADQIAALRLPLEGTELVRFGDGREATLRVYRGAVRWHEGLAAVRVIEIEGGPVLGMALLHGSRLTVDVVRDGPVRIEPLGGADGG